MLEDHVADLSKHRYLTGAGYRIIRRYENNGWYVPSESTVGRQWSDRWEVLRKYYLALPFRILRNLSRRIRKAIDDAFAGELQWIEPSRGFKDCRFLTRSQSDV